MLEYAEELLKRYFGFSEFRPGQSQIIESILTGRDTFAVMPTGAGKSVCFQIPALVFSGVTLVISPLISLMKDQVDSLTDAGIPATYINSSLRNKEVKERITRAGAGEFKLIYIAPERLESESFSSLFENLTISFVAIDEAHCVSQWGHDFRPSYRRIGPFIKGLSFRPVIAAFTATATEEVKTDIIKLLCLKNPEIYVTGFDRKNLFFSVLRGVNKDDFILDYLKEHRTSSGIIYAATRKEVENLYDLLTEEGYNVGKYHAGLSDGERVKTQEAFLYEEIDVIVATNAFGMGIDKSNVRYVMHYNMPKNMESYYQEAGRAGRDGEPSECILLFGPQDILLQKYLIEKTVFSPARRNNEYRKLQTMVDYVHTTRCLRKFILEYFGETEIPDECGNCSVCNDYGEVTDITVQAQKIFSCILRMKEKYGITTVADVLKGSRNKKILRLSLDRVSTYGTMADYPLSEIKDLINILIAEGYLRLAGGKFPVVKVTKKAIEVCKNREKVYRKVVRQKKGYQVDNTLFQRLRALRKEIAEQEGIPPYIVFSDASLRQMCEILPTDRKTFLGVKGVGEIKFDKYGREFLAAISEHINREEV